MRDDYFEWDDRKAAANVRKHGVSFELARQVLGDQHAVEKLDVDEQDEDRILLTGLAGTRLLTVCYVQRGTRCRIISARKANNNEREAYNQSNR